MATSGPRVPNPQVNTSKGSSINVELATDYITFPNYVGKKKRNPNDTLKGSIATTQLWDINTLGQNERMNATFWGFCMSKANGLEKKCLAVPLSQNDSQRQLWGE